MRIAKEELPAGYSWVDLEDEDFNNTLSEIIYGENNLHLNGAGGTGKSTMIELAYKMMKDKKILVLSSTGISSSSINDKGLSCSTIHSGLGIPVLNWYSKRVPIKQTVVEALADFDVIFFDEISMVSSNLFDQIGRIVRKAEIKKRGKIRLVCFGDILQLSPVVSFNDRDLKRNFESEYEGKVFFFNSFEYEKRNFKLINLDNIYRQESESLQNILNSIRLNIASKQQMKIINSQKVDIETFIDENPYRMILATTRQRVDELNEEYGIPYGQKKITYRGRIENNFKLKDCPLIKEEVTIYKGQQVMCVKNMPDDGYQNGTLGTVIDLDNKSVTIMKPNGNTAIVSMCKWIQSELAVNKEGEGYLKKSGSYTQIGCMPALAVTFHKAQSLTLDAVYLDLSSRFIPDSGIYLALSRCKTLEGIGLSRKIRGADIHLNDEAYDFIYDNVLFPEE